MSHLYIKESSIKKAGRGVYTDKNIKKGEIIEICPVLALPRLDYPKLKETEVRNYYFMWGKTTVAICFGYGSLYNHSYSPNATYLKSIRNKTITFKAIQDISRNEEITVNYNYGNPQDTSPLWIKKIKAIDIIS